jgi:hypothetical protein
MNLRALLCFYSCNTDPVKQQAVVVGGLGATGGAGWNLYKEYHEPGRKLGVVRWLDHGW